MEPGTEQATQLSRPEENSSNIRKLYIKTKNNNKYESK